MWWWNWGNRKWGESSPDLRLTTYASDQQSSSCLISMTLGHHCFTEQLHMEPSPNQSVKLRVSLPREITRRVNETKTTTQLQNNEVQKLNSFFKNRLHESNNFHLIQRVLIVKEKSGKWVGYRVEEHELLILMKVPVSVLSLVV